METKNALASWKPRAPVQADVCAIYATSKSFAALSHGRTNEHLGTGGLNQRKKHIHGDIIGILFIMGYHCL